MYTTIKVSDELKSKLDRMKISDSESYEDVIEGLIEDRLSLNPDFIKDIENRRLEVKKGKHTSLSQIKKELSLDV